MPPICQEDGQGRKEEIEAHHQELPHLHQAQSRVKSLPPLTPFTFSAFTLLQSLFASTFLE
jgi:hypothetical protein